MFVWKPVRPIRDVTHRALSVIRVPLSWAYLKQHLSGRTAALESIVRRRCLLEGELGTDSHLELAVL
jgi:hypothetical protein